MNDFERRKNLVGKEIYKKISIFRENIGKNVQVF